MGCSAVGTSSADVEDVSLPVLADIEALLTRGRPIDEIGKVIAPRIKQYIPLSANTAQRENLLEERRQDHIGHFVLRLAFCRTQVALILA